GLSIVVLGNTTYYPAQRSVQNAVDAGWAAAIGTPDLALDRSTTSAPVPRYEAQPAQIQTVLAAANLVTDFDEAVSDRSEEHTSELQSRFDLVCRLLLE